MSIGYTEFLIDPSGKPPCTLPELIRQVANSSAGFSRSWTAGDLDDAHATSAEAFSCLDHIQNELLRHRDEKSQLIDWRASPFNAALNATIGSLVEPVLPAEKAAFLVQDVGTGSIPSSATVGALTLAAALNKLKHRKVSGVNFSIANASHTLYFLTYAGMGRPDSLSGFDVQTFCNACKVAVRAL